jgi:hypothetical protein
MKWSISQNRRGWRSKWSYCWSDGDACGGGYGYPTREAAEAALEAALASLVDGARGAGRKSLAPQAGQHSIFGGPDGDQPWRPLVRP